MQSWIEPLTSSYLRGSSVTAEQELCESRFSLSRFCFKWTGGKPAIIFWDPEWGEPYSGRVTLPLVLPKNTFLFFFFKKRFTLRTGAVLGCTEKNKWSGVNSSKDLQSVFCFQPTSYSHPLPCMLSPRAGPSYYSFGNGCSSLLMPKYTFFY